MTNNIEVFVCMPHNKQEYRLIENSLEGIQGVGINHFAILPLWESKKAKIALVYDDEVYITRKDNLDEFRTLWIDSHWILGNCFLCRMEKGQFVTLTESDKVTIENYMKGEKIQ